MRGEKSYSPTYEATRVLRAVADICTVVMCVFSVLIAITLLVIGVKINGEYTRITRMVITEDAVADAHSLLHQTAAMSARAAAGQGTAEDEDLALVVRNLAAALTEALLALAAAVRGLRGNTLNAFLESISSPEFKVATYGVVTRALDDLERVQNALGYIMSTVATSPK